MESNELRHINLFRTSALMKWLWKTVGLLALGCLGFGLANGQAPSDDEKGKQLVEKMCSSCHEPAGWSHSKEEWEGIVPDHAARGGVSPSEADVRLTVAYLTRHFGAAQVASNTQAASGNLSAEGAKGEKLYEKACGGCHSAGGGWVHTKEEWEAIAPEMASRSGEALTDSDLSVLVSYLTAKFGPKN